MVFCVILFAMLLQPARTGQTAVWTPPRNFPQELHKTCSNGPVAPCMEQQMKQNGAPPATIAFTRAIGGTGYMTAFRPVGRVAIASVLDPFRANENELLFFVTTGGPPINVDDTQKLAKDSGMLENAAFKDLETTHPGLLLWPADRSSTEAILALATRDGEQQFVVPYLLATCHACERLGTAFFQFDFDSRGSSYTTAFNGILPERQVKTSSFLLNMRPGRTSTLLLDGNPSTGYQWSSDPPLQSATMRPPTSRQRPGMVGAPEQQGFLIKAPASGEQVIQFSYRRPWEKQARPARELRVVIRVS